VAWRWSCFPEHAGRELRHKINKKMYRAGMASIFSQLAREGRLAVVDSLSVDSPKTKVPLFKATNHSVLVIADVVDENLYLASTTS
jgi:large subunit ribosomal protein L4